MLSLSGIGYYQQIKKQNLEMFSGVARLVAGFICIPSFSYSARTCDNIYINELQMIELRLYNLVWRHVKSLLVFGFTTEMC